MADLLPPVLQATQLSKTFGTTTVLSDVSMRVGVGEIHGLVGHNGSGKSTLIKIIAGYEEPDGGSSVAFDGVEVRTPVSPRDLTAHGVRFVHQQLGLIDRLTVAENLWLDEISRGTRESFGFQQLCSDAQAVLAEFGLDITPDMQVSQLNAVEKTNLAIVRAAAANRAGEGSRGYSGLLVLDESTAFLPDEHKHRLYELVELVSNRGMGVLFVSHFLDEVVQLCDVVTVLRDGHAVLSNQEVGTMSSADLARYIVGEDVQQASGERRRTTTGPMVHIDSVTTSVLRGVSLELAPGEVVGVTGVLGCGLNDVPRAIFGVIPATGSVTVGTDTYRLVDATPSCAMRSGVGFVPADRPREGVFAALSVVDNVTANRLPFYRSKFGLRRAQMCRDAGTLAQDYGVRLPSLTSSMSALSGGNAQKVVMAKWMQLAPTLLLLEEPTQGVDIGARRQIEARILDIAQEGTTVLLISADPEQLADLCDRVIVLNDGHITDVLCGSDVTKTTIAHACLTGRPATDYAKEMA